MDYIIDGAPSILFLILPFEGKLKLKSILHLLMFEDTNSGFVYIVVLDEAYYDDRTK